MGSKWAQCAANRNISVWNSSAPLRRRSIGKHPNPMNRKGHVATNCHFWWIRLWVFCSFPSPAWTQLIGLSNCRCSQRCFIDWQDQTRHNLNWLADLVKVYLLTMESHNNWPYLLSLYLPQTYVALCTTGENEHAQRNTRKRGRVWRAAGRKHII